MLEGLRKSKAKIKAYGGSEIKQYGTCQLKLKHCEQEQVTSFYVVESKGPIIIGLPTCRSLGFVTLNFNIAVEGKESEKHRQKGDDKEKQKILNEYGDVFEGIGCFEGECRIVIDPNVPPVIHPPRRVPEALKKPLEEELESLVKQGIITKVDEPTDWVRLRE